MTELKGIKIVSDGTVMGTHVLDSEGKDITRTLYIRGIKWTHNAGGIPIAELTCLLSEIEASNVDGHLDERWIVDISTHASEYSEYDDIRNIQK